MENNQYRKLDQKFLNMIAKNDNDVRDAVQQGIMKKRQNSERSDQAGEVSKIDQKVFDEYVAQSKSKRQRIE